MKLFDFCKFFESILNTPVYPLQYPFNKDDNELFTLDITYGYSLGDGVKSSTVQFQCRGEHPSIAEDKAEELIKALENKTNLIYKDHQIIRMRPSFTHPYFLGVDANGRFLFTVDFVIITNKLTKEE